MGEFFLAKEHLSSIVFNSFVLNFCYFADKACTNVQVKLIVKIILVAFKWSSLYIASYCILMFPVSLSSNKFCGCHLESDLSSPMRFLIFMIEDFKYKKNFLICFEIFAHTHLSFHPVWQLVATSGDPCSSKCKDG